MIVNKRFTIIPFASSLQEDIMQFLTLGPARGMDVLRQVSINSSTTKQGVYKILRHLLGQEIIVKENGFFILNKLWLSRIKEFATNSEDAIGLRLPFSSPSSNRKKVIIFKDAEALDIYWGHLYLTLTQAFKDSPIFFFNHHSWSIYERAHSEKYLYESSLKKSQKVLITLGSNTQMAQKFKKQFSKNNIQITIDEHFSMPKTDHICVIGDYCILTRYDNKAMAQINSLFNNSGSLNEPEIKELHKILMDCKKPKIIISKNSRLANIWKRRLAKNFIIKKSELL